MSLSTTNVWRFRGRRELTSILDPIIVTGEDFYLSSGEWGSWHCPPTFTRDGSTGRKREVRTLFHRGESVIGSNLLKWIRADGKKKGAEKKKKKTVLIRGWIPTSPVSSNFVVGPDSLEEEVQCPPSTSRLSFCPTWTLPTPKTNLLRIGEPFF